MSPKTMFLATVATVLAFSSFANNDNFTRQGYIEQHKDLAISQMFNFDIPASIVLAQALLETANGTGELATNANNHFGIKCKREWTGDTYSLKDDDYDNKGNLMHSCFRAYPSVEESYKDYGKFLSGKPRYHDLFTYGKDYRKWAHGLKAAGYATAANYANNLIKIIEDNQLYLYDAKQPQLITPPRRNYTYSSEEKPSAASANPTIESTDILRKPKEEFELIQPVTRIDMKSPFRHELISPVFRSKAPANYADRAVYCESPVRPMSQAMHLRKFRRR